MILIGRGTKIFMKNLWVVLLAVFPFVGVKATEIKHELSCEVTGYSAVEIRDGKNYSYTNPSDGFEIGDSLNLELKTHDSTGFTFWFGDGDWEYLSKKNKLFSRRVKKLSDIESFDNRFMWSESDSMPPLVRGKLVTNSDHIYVSRGRITARDMSSTLRLNRYYKGDWSGILDHHSSTDEGGDFTEITTFNCRTTVDGLESLIKKVAGKNADVMPSENSNSKDGLGSGRARGAEYPTLPFSTSIEDLLKDLVPEGTENAFFQEEAMLRCSGLLTVLLRAKQSDGLVSGDGEEKINALVFMVAVDRLNKRFRRSDQTQENLIPLYQTEVPKDAGAYGEQYARWVNANGFTDRVLADTKHPFTSEFRTCQNLGESWVQYRKSISKKNS
jgi:hypothetical protein